MAEPQEPAVAPGAGAGAAAPADGPEAGSAPADAPSGGPGASPAAAPALCPRCTGGGWVAGAAVCPGCLGQPYTNIDGTVLVCQLCHGTGRRNVPCPDCGGSGYQRR